MSVDNYNSKISEQGPFNNTIENNFFSNQYTVLRHKIEHVLNQPSIEYEISTIQQDASILWFPYILGIDYLAITKINNTALPANLKDWIGVPIWEKLLNSVKSLDPPIHPSTYFKKLYFSMKVYTCLRLFVQEISQGFIPETVWFGVMNNASQLLERPIQVKNKYLQRVLNKEIELWENLGEMHLSDLQHQQLVDLVKLTEFEKEILFQIIKYIHNNRLNFHDLV